MVIEITNEFVFHSDDDHCGTCGMHSQRLPHGYYMPSSYVPDEKALQAYRQQVITLSDKIDELKERHKILPHLDKDFVVPMSGETLAAYNEIAQRLEHHRQVWLDLMTVWEQAQKLLESERILGNGRARSARRNIRTADAPAALSTLIGDCEAPLDRIEHAHSQAVTDLKSYQQEDQQLGLQLESVKSAALSTTAYEPDRSAAAALVEQAKRILPSDPLATLRCLSEARNKVTAAFRRASKILEHATSASELAKKIADLQQTAAQRRTQGFLLLEEGANPDPLLANAREQHAAIHEVLNQANETAAGTLLTNVSALLDQAHQGMTLHLAAKARCDSEIPARLAEARRLVDAMALARGQHAELTRDFATDTWLNVAENVRHAQASLSAADQYTVEATRAAGATTQHYRLAEKLLNMAAENHRHAQAELAALGQSLQVLIERRVAFHAQIDRLRSRFNQVNHLLQSSSADRALANERFRAARSMFDRLEEDSRQQRPDWAELTTRLAGIDADLGRVEQLAKEDLQLAQQAAAEIAETERFIREARAFQDQGITADVSAAETQLGQARGCLMSQAYEEAIRVANTAEQLARSVHQDAISRAQRRRQELESQLRAEQAAAMPRPVIQAEAPPVLKAEAELW